MVAWKEDVGLLFVLLYLFVFTGCRQGVERQSQARIIYDPDPTNDDS